MSALLASSSSSSGTAFRVYYLHHQTLITLRFRDSSVRVEEVIRQSLEILSDRYMLRISDNPLLYALFPASRSGERAPDAMEVYQSQRVRATALRRFRLEDLHLSNDSISTQINLERKYGFEKAGRREGCGCCCIFQRL
jgi:hypothetical protein